MDDPFADVTLDTDVRADLRRHNSNNTQRGRFDTRDDADDDIAGISTELESEDE